MNICEIILIGIGLAMDAFAVCICKGLSLKRIEKGKQLEISTYFSVFQAIMPLIGYLIGLTFNNSIQKFDHWVSFFLLCVIGINMIKESFDNDIEKKNNKIDIKTLLLLAIATSIDALAVGVTFAFLKTNILLSILIIGIITFILCMAGIKIGIKFGDKLHGRAEIVGGIILILIGFKILIVGIYP